MATPDSDAELMLLLANPSRARKKRDGQCATATPVSSSIMRAVLFRHEQNALSEPVCSSFIDEYCEYLEQALEVVLKSYVMAKKAKQE